MQTCVKDCMGLLDHVYQLALMNNEVFGAVRISTNEQTTLDALNVLVFNGYLKFTDNYCVKITTEGIGARINGFGNARKIYDQL